MHQRSVAQQQTVDELEAASDEADAKLGVAEELGWGMAALSACLLYVLYGSWLASLGGFVATYYAATYKYRRDAKIAETAYYQASNRGPFYKPPPQADSE